MRLYVAASFLFIYSTLLVCDVASKSRLDQSQNPVWMACDHDAWLPFSPLFSPPSLTSILFSQNTLFQSNTHTHLYTHTKRPCDKTCSTVAMHDSPSPVKNDGWTGCVVGLTALFTGRVSRFPCCSDIVKFLDGVQGSGSCMYQKD